MHQYPPTYAALGYFGVTWRKYLAYGKAQLLRADGGGSSNDGADITFRGAHGGTAQDQGPDVKNTAAGLA